MRLYFTIAALGLASLVGCSSSSSPSSSSPNGRATSARVDGMDEPVVVGELVPVEERVAIALAFDPSITIGEPPLMLGREARERSAFVGFEEQTITSFYIRIDDRDYGDGRDRYDRRAIIEKSGATFR